MHVTDRHWRSMTRCYRISDWLVDALCHQICDVLSFFLQKSSRFFSRIERSCFLCFLLCFQYWKEESNWQSHRTKPYVVRCWRVCTYIMSPRSKLRIWIYEYDVFFQQNDVSLTLGHVLEEIVSGEIDVVDDLAEVLVEVGVGQVLEVVQSVLGNVALPLELAWTGKNSYFYGGSLKIKESMRLATVYKG